MFQVVAIGGGTDRTLLASFPSKLQAKAYALEMNAVDTEVVNVRTGMLVGSVLPNGTWRENTTPTRRPVMSS